MNRRRPIRATHGKDMSSVSQATRPFAYVAGFAVLVVLPLLIADSYWLYIATALGIYILVTIGMHVMYSHLGLVSLAQGALMGLSAYTTAILTVTYNINWLVAAIVGIVVAMAVSALMAIIAARMTEWFFVVITLTFAVFFQSLVTGLPQLTNGFAGIVGIQRPGLPVVGASDGAFYVVVVAAVVVAALLAHRLARSRFGVAMACIGTDSLIAESAGVAPWRLRLLACLFGGATAGTGGALIASLLTVITPDTFDFSLSVFFLIAVVIGGSANIWGPIVGATIFFTVPTLLQNTGGFDELIYGLGLLVILSFAPRGLIGLYYRLRAKDMPLVTDNTLRGTAEDGPVPNADRQPADVSLDHVTLAFGGIQVLKEVSLKFGASKIAAIVGPNGSGKTSLLNVICGYYPMRSGKILLNRTVLRGPAAKRARSGVARTFQTPKLLPDYSVADNVILGAYNSWNVGLVNALLRTKKWRSRRSTINRRAISALRSVGCDHLWDKKASDIPHGEQRLVELARALMTEPSVLLLDEPAAGLSLTELEALGGFLSKLRDDNYTVVLVEHHIEMVASLADQLILIDRGSVAASGKPDAVLAMGRTVKAFLGGSVDAD